MSKSTEKPLKENQLSEVDLLKVKCAALEYQLKKTQLESQLEEAVKQRDSIIDPIVAFYKGDFAGNVGIDLSTGLLSFQSDEDQK